MDNNRTDYTTGAPWETLVGYSRAVKVGNHIEVSGTVAVDEAGAVIGEGDAYLQTKFILQKIETVLLKAGATLNHVVRTRMYVTDIKNWEACGKAHAEAFTEGKPCTTLVQVSNLISPAYLIEIEATAILY